MPIEDNASKEVVSIKNICISRFRFLGLASLTIFALGSTSFLVFQPNNNMTNEIKTTNLNKTSDMDIGKSFLLFKQEVFIDNFLPETKKISYVSPYLSSFNNTDSQRDFTLTKISINKYYNQIFSL